VSVTSSVALAVPIEAEQLFGRHLDLTPLGRRRRGTVFCPFHADRHHPSLSVDLDRGLFHCFACGAEGGVRRFGELVGEVSSQVLRRQEEQLSPLSEARRRVLREARRHLARLEPYREFFAESDSIRIGHRLVARARRVATACGPRPDVWDLLAAAAWLETSTFRAEAAA